MSDKLEIPGATRLAVEDWQELMIDVANTFDEHLLTPEELAGPDGGTTTAENLRVFAKYLPELLRIQSKEIEELRRDKEMLDWLSLQLSQPSDEVPSGEIIGDVILYGSPGGMASVYIGDEKDARGLGKGLREAISNAMEASSLKETE